MGAGGDSLTSRRFDAAEVETSAARPSRNVRRRSRLAPTGGKALARRTTSYERIANASYEKLHELADWRRIGLHEKYADETMARPMTRGWMHIGIALLATSAFASAAGRAALRAIPGARLFWLVTFVFPYWASTCLHFIPWKRRAAHDLALVFDFIGISLGFSGQAVAWAPGGEAAVFDLFLRRGARGSGARGVLAQLSFSLVQLSAAASLVATAALAAFLFRGYANRAREPVMLYLRNVRFGIVGVNMLLLGFVESVSIADWRVNLASQLLGKAFVPWYFLRCVAVDSSAKGPLPIWPGVWSAHENWHVAVFVLHCVQLYALVTARGQGVE